MLEAIAQFVDSVRATLVFDDTVDPLRSVLYTSCLDGESAARYLESFMLMSPWRLAAREQTADGILLASCLPPDETPSSSRPSDDLLWKRGLVDVVVAVLERTATTTTLLSLDRSADQGVADDVLRRKIGFIAPHLKRAAAMGRALVQRRTHEASLAAALDRMSAAVFLLDPAGAIVHANAAAQRLMAEGKIVRDAAGALLPRFRAGRKALAGALDSIRATALTSRGLPLAMAGDDEFVGTLIPLTQMSPNNVGSHRAAAILCVRPAILETTDAAATFAERHGLTPRELSVLTAIVEHGGIFETAAALGLSEGTVKGYVKAVFQKTGARRQADLVRMVAGFASPFK